MFDNLYCYVDEACSSLITTEIIYYKIHPNMGVVILHQRQAIFILPVSVDLVVSLNGSYVKTERIESCCLPFTCVGCRVLP